jgi:hypothetical protein
VEYDAVLFGAYVSEGHGASIFSIPNVASRIELSIIYRMYNVAPTRLFAAQLLAFPSVCITDCLFMGGRDSVAKLQTANGFISEKAGGFLTFLLGKKKLFHSY